MQMLLADSCFNITHDSFMNDLDETIQRAESHKVKYFFAPAARESEIENLLHHCKVYEGKIYCSIGIHPHYASELKPKTFDRLLQYAKHHKVKAIGETGLDYYRNLSSRENQIRSFEYHIDISKELDKPLIIHCRDSFSDVYDMLRNKDTTNPIILHSLTCGNNWTKKFIDLDIERSNWVVYSLQRFLRFKHGIT